ncbi:MAG: hypothetical protein M1823_000207 [Watsoniomyces obsoletus]|nr:MAG: hypothetical protein M1823_000207 [Watsoniomyces obsoletus]
MSPQNPSARAFRLATTAGRLFNARPSVCLLCRNQATHITSRAPFTTTARRASALDSLRRKIWGTDNPPGQADPYTRLSPEEKERELRRQAEREAKKAASDTSADRLGAYVPATTWNDLERVGEPDLTVEEEWLREHQFQGFLSAEALSNPVQLTAALHQAVVEVLTLHQAGEPLTELPNVGPDEHLTTSVQVAPSDDARGAALVFPADEVHEEILRSLRGPENATGMSLAQEEGTEPSSDQLTEHEVAPRGPLDPPEEESNQEKGEVDSSLLLSEETVAVEDTETPLHEDTPASEVDINQLEAMVVSWGDSWLAIPLKDMSIKFAVVKRVMQLTGTRIADPAIAQIDSVGSLHAQLIRPPPPTKLAQALLDNDHLTSLPNVKVFPRRVTPIDKERVVGRWKVIEKELIARGLPVTGRT